MLNFKYQMEKKSLLRKIKPYAETTGEKKNKVI